MPVITRGQDWVDGEVLYADVLDGQFNKIYNLLNGTDDAGTIVLGAVVPQNPDAKLTTNGQIVLQPTGSGAVVRVFHTTSLILPTVDISALGWIKLRAGSAGNTPAEQQMYAAGCLYFRSNNIGNVGVGEDDLHSFTIGKNVFGTGGNNSFARVRMRGYTAANGNNKQLKFYGKTTVLMASGVMTENNKPWELDIIIAPDEDGVSTVTVSGTFKCGATEVRVNTQLAGYDFTVDNVWKMTGEATANDDLVSNIMIVDIGRGLNF